MNDAKNGSDSGSPETNPDRLDGWKEISAYLRRAPRTAQRWEAQFSLPVHRIGGEVVFALRSEIDAWAASEASRSAAAAANGDAEDGNGSGHGAGNGTDHPSAGAHEDRQHPRRRWIGLTGRGWGYLAAASAAVAFAVTLAVGGFADPTPVQSWRVNGDELRAFDADGRELWMYRLPTRESIVDSGPVATITDDQRRSMIDDLDGDGRNELRFVTRTADARQSRLFVFEADGTLRFSRHRTGDVTFGDTVYHGPFQGAWVEVTQNADGSKSLWYQSRHVPFFASVLEKLDARGNLLADFWNGGSITQLAVGSSGGRRMVLIGGDANEGHGATVALFPEERVGGAGVGADYAHTCTSCGSVRPETVFLFPRHKVGRVTQGESKISYILVSDDAELLVDVEYTHLEVPGVPGQQHAIGHFVFDATLNLKHAEHYSAYRLIHDHFFRQGLTDHPYGDADVAELLPIRRWAGGTAFEPVYLSGTRPAVVPASQPMPR